MSFGTQQLSRWLIRSAATLVLLNGLFWIWFGIACAWPDPLGMVAHMRFPALPLLVLGLIAWFQPTAAGAILILWGVQPLLATAVGIDFQGDLLSLTTLSILGVPLVAGVTFMATGMLRRGNDTQ